ncbi:hypothetical protein KLEB273_gp255 [Bacillus phage vB_BauM_KLEB27-3]|nr:hypothetical protein KLEB273_gp255 [Bacillus phage vB_BauM_KLEB27-3]
MKKKHDSEYIMLVTNHYYVLFNKYVFAPFLFVASIIFTYHTKGFTANGMILYFLYLAFVVILTELLDISLLENKKKLIERKMYLEKNKR